MIKGGGGRTRGSGKVVKEEWWRKRKVLNESLDTYNEESTPSENNRKSNVSERERERLYVRESAFNRRGAEWRKWKSISVL